MFEIIPPDKDWIDLLSALLTPTVAAIGIYIAYQQRLINQNRLKHELFDKRYEVYERIGEFISSILTTGTVRAGSDLEFLRDTKAVTLLFDTDIKQFTSEIYEKAVHLHCLESELEGMVSEERKINIEKQREIKNWYTEQLKTMEIKFIRYLKLEH